VLVQVRVTKLSCWEAQRLQPWFTELVLPHTLTVKAVFQ